MHTSMHIGDLAKATGKTSRALRLYEELGLLVPGNRTSGGFRVYGPDAIHRVQWLSKLQDLGFTLPQIQELVAVTAQQHVPREGMARVRAIFREKLDDVASQIARLSQLQRELIGSLDYLESCNGCIAENHGPSACTKCQSHGEEAAPALIVGIAGTAAQKKKNAEKNLDAADVQYHTENVSLCGSNPKKAPTSES